MPRIYTKPALKSTGYWAFADDKLEANINAGTIPPGRIVDGKRLWNQEEADQIAQAQLDNKLVPARSRKQG